MFKNLTTYLLPKAAQLITPELPEQLAAVAFKPCGPTEPESWGFVPPNLKEGGALFEQLGGDRLVVAVRRQQRKVPGETLRKRVDELASAIEKQTGRKPGAKRRRELKDEALLELLPQAFTRDSMALVLVERVTERLVVNTTSTGMLDGVLTTLCKAIPGVAPHPWVLLDSFGSWMGKSLADGDDMTGFALGRDLALEHDTGRRVAWANADLLSKDVQDNLAEGATVVRMAMVFNGRTEFTLTEDGQIKGLAMDVAAFAQTADAESVEEAWRADAELWTAELALVLDELERELGGRVELAELAAGQESPQPPDGEPDPLFDQAVTLVFEHKKASISFIQRHLRIGYNRAARLLERMEVEGLVSAMSSNGSRELLKVAA